MSHALIFDRFVVDWSPKCGCTVVLKMWYDHVGLLDEALKYSEWIHNYRVKKSSHMFYKPNQFKVENPVFIKFTRNPYHRAVSSYIHACRTKLLANGSVMTFKQFVFDFLPVEFNRPSCNDHWKPQHKIPWALPRHDHVIHIEQLEQEIDSLNHSYNIKPPLKCNYTSFHHVKQEHYVPEAYNIKFENLITNESEYTSPTYDSFYNEEIKQQVYRLYQQDVDLYKYSYECE